MKRTTTESIITVSLLIIGFIFCLQESSLAKATAAQDVEIVLEAELASNIQGHMVVGVPEDPMKQGGPKPNAPSNGKFIWMPGTPKTIGFGQGFAEFIIDIPKKDTYAIWGRVIAWDGNSDSFWVTWQPADPDENPQQTNNNEYRWDIYQHGHTWFWFRVNKWLNAGIFEREWELDQGETILRIWTREDAAMLDCLLITNNLGASANDMRLPNDDDRKLQIRGDKATAVEAIDKLYARWGYIRSKYH